MDKKTIVSKVMLKLSSLDPVHVEFLEEAKNIKDPKQLVYRLQQHSNTRRMDRQTLIKFLGKAKEFGIFKKHFSLPNMEKGWRFWVKEHGLANQFRFES